MKKDSAGFALRTRRVRLVSAARIRPNSKWSRYRLTLVPLLLDLECLGKVLILLPFDGGADGAVVDEVALIADLLLVEVSLVEDLVLKKVVRSEMELNLEAGLLLLGRKVGDGDVNEALERVSVAIGNHLAERGVIAERGEPELGDGRGGVLAGGLRERSVLWVLLLFLLLARLDLLRSRLRLASNDRTATLMQRLLELRKL